MKYRYTMFLLLFVGVIICLLGYTVYKHDSCDRSGGTYANTITGWECIPLEGAE